MKKGLTELVCILDKSGSMGGLESDTIGGFNSMIERHKKLEGECRVTTVLFDNGYELIHDRIDIRELRPMTEKDYQVGGGTALLDAVGRTMHKIRAAQKAIAEEYKAEHVIFVIITDGQENSSRKYTYDHIKARIEHQKSKYDWDFIFLGANMDAVAEAGRLGIDRNMAAGFVANRAGVWESYACASNLSAGIRKK